MRELLSAEFYKLYKSLGFRVCLIVFFVQDIIYLISVGLVGDILGMELTGDFIYNPPVVKCCFDIFSAISNF